MIGMSLLTVFQVSESDKGARVREVAYDTTNRVARCSCARFESDGIPCRHVLVVLQSCQVNEMPSHYLLSRWAKNSTDVPSTQWLGMPSVANGLNVGKLWTIFTRCVANAKRFEAASSFATKRLESMECELNEYLSPSPVLACEASSVGSVKSADNIAIHPPKMSKTKRSGRKIKGEKELAMERQEKRPHLCEACGVHAYHDRLNCPPKLEA